MLIVNYLPAHVDGGAIAAECCFDDSNRALDAGAEGARPGEDRGTRPQRRRPFGERGPAQTQAA